jgi:hypothetical protein
MVGSGDCVTVEGDALSKGHKHVLAWVAVAALCACTPQVEKDWIVAERTGTEGAYKEFLGRYKAGEHAEEARRRLAEIVGEREKAQAQVEGEANRVIQLTILEWFLFFAPDDRERKLLIEKSSDLVNQTGFSRFIEVETQPEPAVLVREGFMVRDTFTVVESPDGQSLIDPTTLLAFMKEDATDDAPPLASLEREVKDGKLAVPLETIGTRHGYRFGEAWATPVVVVGSSFPRVRFRRGSISLLNGSIQIDSGTEAEIQGQARKLADGHIRLVPAKQESLSFKFRDGLWEQQAH